MGKHDHWESDLSDLEIDAAAQMQVTQSGFEVIAQDNQGQKWHIRQDSRIWASK
jgi:hypothetical protein